MVAEIIGLDRELKAFEDFSVIHAETLKQINKKIESLLSDKTIKKIISAPLVLPVGGSRTYYKDTPIAIRFWWFNNFEFMRSEPRYDIAVKLTRKDET